MDRRQGKSLASPGAAGRLGVDGNDLVARRYEGVECRDGELGRTHEDEAHPPPLSPAAPGGESAIAWQSTGSPSIAISWHRRKSKHSARPWHDFRALGLARRAVRC